VAAVPSGLSLTPLRIIIIIIKDMSGVLNDTGTVVNISERVTHCTKCRNGDKIFAFIKINGHLQGVSQITETEKLLLNIRSWMNA
jgi:hypothetical protein